MVSNLNLTVLIDGPKSTDNLLVGEFGLSFFVRTGEKNILFDTGSSRLFLANAGVLGIDLRDLDYVVLSHGHDDHTGGLVPLVSHRAVDEHPTRPSQVPELIAHSRCFYPKSKGQIS